jgi:pectin methylesterase-like acyl-CoA thioesterase
MSSGAPRQRPDIVSRYGGVVGVACIVVSAVAALGCGGAHPSTEWTSSADSGGGSSPSSGSSGGSGGGTGASSGGGAGASSGSGSGRTDGGSGGGASSGGGSSGGSGGADAGAGDASAGSGGHTDSGATTGTDASTGADGNAGALCTAASGSQAITVAADGSGQFPSVQAAVNSIASGTTPIRIDIKPGTYTENLTIGNRANITLCGQDAMTTIVTFAASGSSEATATRVSGNNFAAANITFENSSPLGSGQAVALLASGNQQQFLNCRFVSYQDTLYTKSGSQYFKNCYVQGNTDYVFGAGTAVLDNCTIYNVSGGTAVTAPNTASATAYGIVFLGGTLTAASTVSAGSVALGRPWGATGSTTYLNTSLGAHISAVGWVPFGTTPVAGARFAEYKSTGAGSHPTMRAAGTTQLTDTQAAQYTIANILNGWVPSFSQ